MIRLSILACATLGPITKALFIHSMKCFLFFENEPFCHGDYGFGGLVRSIFGA